MSKSEEANQTGLVLSKETVDKSEEQENADNERQDAKREGVPVGVPPMDGPKPPGQNDEDSEACTVFTPRTTVFSQLL